MQHSGLLFCGLKNLYDNSLIIPAEKAINKVEHNNPISMLVSWLPGWENYPVREKSIFLSNSPRYSSNWVQQSGSLYSCETTGKLALCSGYDFNDLYSWPYAMSLLLHNIPSAKYTPFTLDTMAPWAGISVPGLLGRLEWIFHGATANDWGPFGEKISDAFQKAYIKPYNPKLYNPRNLKKIDAIISNVTTKEYIETLRQYEKNKNQQVIYEYLFRLIKKYGSIQALLEDAFNPIKNGFKLIDQSQVPFELAGKNIREIWTDAEVILTKIPSKKVKQTIIGDSKKEEEYPRLFENPNAIYLPEEDKVVDWDDEPCIAFSYYDGILKVGKWTHQSLNYDNGPERGEYSGRLFTKSKIITFWHFPENKTVLKSVLRDIQEKINNGDLEPIYVDFSFGWKVEIPNNFEKLKKYPTKSKNGNMFPNPDWGDWWPKKNSQKFIDIDDYNGEYERSSDELKQEHVISPLLKNPKSVKPGFGSKHPRAPERFEKEMSSTFESVQSFYEKLNESPDNVSYRGKEYFVNKDSMAFVVKVDEISKEIISVEFGPPGKYHDSAKLGSNWYSGSKIYVYPGRVFMTPKILTFWTYPSDEEMKIIIPMMEEKLQTSMLDHTWRIEFRKNARKGLFRYGTDSRSEDVSYPFLDVYMHKRFKSKDVPEDEHQQHLISPLLKKHKKVPYGFGSNNPKYDKIQHAKWDAPYENQKEEHYPRLFE